MSKLKLGLPAGSLQKTTIDIFKKAGFNIYLNDVLFPHMMTMKLK